MVAPNHMFSIKSLKYGTPTGTGTVPATGDLTALPMMAKGSISLDESESTVTDFYAEQSPYPIESIATENGKFTLTAKFNDMNFATLAVFKGGTGNATSFEPATGWFQVKKAFVAELDSSHTFDFRNSQCMARITDLGGRDKLGAWELKATPLLCADGSAPYKINNL